MEKCKNHIGERRTHCWQVKVVAEAHLDDWFKDYFGSLDVHDRHDGCSIISGVLADMPAVYGLILSLRDTGIILLSLEAVRTPVEDHFKKRA